MDSTFSVICWLRAEELSPGWAENRKIAAMMANVTHSITARTSFSLLFCSGIPVPPRSIVPSCIIHMAYLKSIPVLRCRIKRKKDTSAWIVRCYIYFIFHFIISALIGCKTAKRAAALTDCGPTYYFMRCGYTAFITERQCVSAVHTTIISGCACSSAPCS